MTYKQIEQQVIDKLITDWKLAKSCTSEWDGNISVCNKEIYITDNIDNIEETNDAMKDILNHSFGKNYFNESIKLDTSIDARAGSDGEIEFENVSIFFKKTAYKAKSEEDFSRLIANERMVEQEIKKLVTDIFFNNSTETWLRTPDCTTMKLWRDGIISFEQLEKATYSNC